MDGKGWYLMKVVLVGRNVDVWLELVFLDECFLLFVLVMMFVVVEVIV